MLHIHSKLSRWVKWTLYKSNSYLSYKRCAPSYTWV